MSTISVSRPGSMKLNSQVIQTLPMASVGIDSNLDGRANYVVTGVDRNNDGIPDVLQKATIPYTTATIPASTGSIPAAVPLSTYVSTEAPVILPYRGETAYTIPTTEYTIEKYRGPTYVSPVRELSLVPYSERSFTHDVWHEVLRPIGLGIASPIAGAGAFVAGVVGGAGALVAGCAFGVVSTVRGVFGLIPIGTDYVLRPVAYGVDYTAAGMDNAIDKATGEKKRTEAFYSSGSDWWWLFGYDSSHKVAPQPRAITNGAYTTGTYAPIVIEARPSRPGVEIIRPSTSASFVEYETIRPDYFATTVS